MSRAERVLLVPQRFRVRRGRVRDDRDAVSAPTGIATIGTAQLDETLAVAPPHRRLDAVFPQRAEVFRDLAGDLARRDLVHPRRVDERRELCGSADKFRAVFHQRGEKKDEPPALGERPAVARQLPDVVGVARELQLAVFDVAPDAVERRLAAAALLLDQREAGVHRAADRGRAGDAREHILGVFFSQVVNEQERDAVRVGDALERGEVAVVVGVGHVPPRVADHLERVDDDEHRVGVLREERFELLLQTFAEDERLGTEVDVGRRVICDLVEPVLDAERGVLQAEVERRAAFCRHAPNGFALGDGDGKPEREPRLADLRRAREDVQPCREQRVHDEVQRLELRFHQRLAVYGLEGFAVVFQFRFFPFCFYQMTARVRFFDRVIV